MSHLMPLVTLRQPTGDVIRRLTRRLRLGGLRVEQTFDLQAARQSHADYPCPNHGTNACTCQMIVLVVYAEASSATVIVHGRDGWTYLSLADGAGEVVRENVSRAILPLAGISELQHPPGYADRHRRD